MFAPCRGDRCQEGDRKLRSPFYVCGGLAYAEHSVWAAAWAAPLFRKTRLRKRPMLSVAEATPARLSRVSSPALERASVRYGSCPAPDCGCHELGSKSWFPSIFLSTGVGAAEVEVANAMGSIGSPM